MRQFWVLALLAGCLSVEDAPAQVEDLEQELVAGGSCPEGGRYASHSFLRDIKKAYVSCRAEYFPIGDNLGYQQYCTDGTYQYWLRQTYTSAFNFTFSTKFQTQAGQWNQLGDGVGVCSCSYPAGKTCVWPKPFITLN